MFIKQQLKVSEINDLKLAKTFKCSKCNFESVWLDVMKNNETLTIGGIYRHPGGNPAHFNTAIEATLNQNN